MPRPFRHGEFSASTKSLSRSLPASLAISPSPLSRVCRVVSSAAHNTPHAPRGVWVYIRASEKQLSVPIIRVLCW